MNDFWHSSGAGRTMLLVAGIVDLVLAALFAVGVLSIRKAAIEK